MALTHEQTTVAHRFGEALMLLLLEVDRSSTEQRAAALVEASQRAERATQQIERKQAPEGLLRPRDAAKYLAIGDRKLWEITSPRGPIPVTKFGKAVRYSVRDLDAAVQKLTNKRGREML